MSYLDRYEPDSDAPESVADDSLYNHDIEMHEDLMASIIVEAENLITSHPDMSSESIYQSLFSFAVAQGKPLSVIQVEMIKSAVKQYVEDRSVLKPIIDDLNSADRDHARQAKQDLIDSLTKGAIDVDIDSVSVDTRHPDTIVLILEKIEDLRQFYTLDGRSNVDNLDSLTGFFNEKMFLDSPLARKVVFVLGGEGVEQATRHEVQHRRFSAFYDNSLYGFPGDLNRKINTILHSTGTVEDKVAALEMPEMGVFPDNIPTHNKAELVRDMVLMKDLLKKMKDEIIAYLRGGEWVEDEISLMCVIEDMNFHFPILKVKLRAYYEASILAVSSALSAGHDLSDVAQTVQTSSDIYRMLSKLHKLDNNDGLSQSLAENLATFNEEENRFWSSVGYDRDYNRMTGMPISLRDKVELSKQVLDDRKFKRHYQTLKSNIEARYGRVENLAGLEGAVYDFVDGRVMTWGKRYDILKKFDEYARDTTDNPEGNLKESDFARLSLFGLLFFN